jgi:hypothetical protein
MQSSKVMSSEEFTYKRLAIQDSGCKSYFEWLGVKVDQMWKEKHYDETAFPGVANRVLQDDPPSQKVSFWDAVKYGFLTHPLPFQADVDAAFGQPPLTVYWHPDFRIELLFWVQSLPGIHQHAFSGAFHVMHGSSLHTIWGFECEERVVARLLYGNLKLRKAELLHTGATRPIVAGSNFIHATYHLDRPTVSVVIRTNREEDHLPQYLYLPPSIAYDSFRPGPLIKRRTQLMRMLASAGRESELLDLVFHLLETTDTLSAFHCLSEAYILFQDESDRNRILLAAARNHHRLVEFCYPALLAREHRDRIGNLRDRVVNPDLQFFLALLLNVPERDTIFQLVRDRYERGDPIARVVGWITELSRLGLLDVKFPDIWLIILRSLLAGATIPQLEQALMERYGKEAIANRTMEIEQLAAAIKNYWLFQPLFVPSLPEKRLVESPSSRDDGSVFPSSC